MKKFTIITLVSVIVALTSASCEKELLTLPTTYVRATDHVLIKFDAWEIVSDSLDVQAPPLTKVYVTAITDSVAVCVNDYCYKLYRDEWAMVCTPPQDGRKRDNGYLFELLNN